MRRLALIRHAKSSWADPLLDDHDRPLAPRGERAAALLRGWLVAHGDAPAQVLCSTALRATQTLEAIAPALGDPEISVEDGLYHATAADLLDRVRAIPDTVGEAVLIGHNPALQDLAVLIARRSPERDRVSAKLPTGALVTLVVDVSHWADTRPGSAAIESLVLPRELETGRD